MAHFMHNDMECSRYSFKFLNLPDHDSVDCCGYQPAPATAESCSGWGNCRRAPLALPFLSTLHGDGWKGRDIMFNTMLVDDNFLIMQLVESKLHDQFPSMEIIEAVDGAEALQKIESHPPNLIFMDIHLPGEDGLELTRKIKADHPDIIIIIFTSHDSPEYREAAIRYKADYFFHKGSIIANNGIFTLVKSILLEKGFSMDGSDN